MYNYITSYEVYNKNKIIGCGNLFTQANKKLLTLQDWNEYREQIEIDCKQYWEKFTYIHIVSITYLGEEEE